MKNIIYSIVVTTLSTTALQAESFYKTGIVTDVKPIYETVLVEKPTTVCNNVEVPIYGSVERPGNAAGGALAGMIIGGLIGKGATGKDNGAAAGAVIGGLIGADQGSRTKTERGIVGYSTERRCTEVLKAHEVKKVTEYAITYSWSDMHGIYYSPYTANIGDEVSIKISMSIIN